MAPSSAMVSVGNDELAQVSHDSGGSAKPGKPLRDAAKACCQWDHRQLHEAPAP